ncbi:MAG: serine hydrolase [Bacteroidota bacterium]|nr:serine hydrolase [Bacteroidota bacterium]
MKKIILSIIIWGIVVIITTPKSSANTFDSAYAQILQSRIEQLKNTYALVGISAAALVPGQGIWTGASGISSSDSDDITSEMVFGAGSVTKNFIAAMILQLDEEDSLDINDSLGKWLPAYTNINSSATLKQLMNHTSGIYNVTDNPNFIAAISSDLNRFWTIEEVLTGGYVLNPYFNPGAGWRYSNTNYMLLGLIIANIMETNLTALFHERFYSPYNLSGSFFEIDDSVTAPFAHNWADITGTGVIQDAFFLPKTALNSSTVGAGGVISRPENLVRYSDNLFNGNIINSNSLIQMLTFRPANISGANGYGLGTMRYTVSGRYGYGHGGNTFGYTTVMIYDPVDKISITIMMNKDHSGGAVGVAFMNTVIQNNPVGISTLANSNPEKFSLHQNFPNPFNPVTNIKFELTNKEFVTLSVLKVLGQEVQVLYKDVLSSGTHSYSWDASGFTSGVYFYKLKTESQTEVKKMLLFK